MVAANIDLNVLLENATGSLVECICIGQTFIQDTIDGLNNKFPDLGIFISVKLFNPSSYPSDDVERETMIGDWLQRLISKLNIDNSIIDIKKCLGELEDSVGIL